MPARSEVHGQYPWLSRPLAAVTTSLAAVMLFCGTLGLVFLPAELRRIFNMHCVSVTHCLDLGARRPLLALAWSMDRTGKAGWKHHLSLQPSDGKSPGTELQIENLRPASLAKANGTGRVFIGDWRGAIYALDLQDLAPRQIADHKDGGVAVLAASADGKWLLSQGANFLHAFESSEPRERWRLHDVVPYCFVVRPDAPQAVIVNPRKEIVEIDLLTGRTLRTLAQSKELLLNISLDADGNKLALIGSDGGVQVLDSHTGKVLWNWRPRRLKIAAGRVVAFSPSGKLLVTASEESGESLSLWNATTGQQLKKLQGHTSMIIGAAFDECGMLRSWGSDGTIRAWDLNTGHTTGVATITVPPSAG
jgi:WD40 repeat protein